MSQERERRLRERGDVPRSHDRHDRQASAKSSRDDAASLRQNVSDAKAPSRIAGALREDGQALPPPPAPEEDGGPRLKDFFRREIEGEDYQRLEDSEPSSGAHETEFLASLSRKEKKKLLWQLEKKDRKKTATETNRKRRRSSSSSSSSSSSESSSSAEKHKRRKRQRNEGKEGKKE